MRTALLATLALTLLMLGGCRSVSNCGQSWDWYQPCDLVEGRQAGCDPCADPCAPQAGRVVLREVAVPAAACAPKVEKTP